MVMRKLLLPLIAALTLSSGQVATADPPRDPFFDGPGNAVPLRFLAANGGTFQPRAIVLATQGSAITARLPRTSGRVRSEDRVDLRSIPYAGRLFSKRLMPSDARQGELIGDVQRVGDTLYVNAANWSGALDGTPVSLATWTPRHGTISYRLGLLDYGQASGPTRPGPILGAAYLIDGQLVIASNGVDRPSVYDLVSGQR